MKENCKVILQMCDEKHSRDKKIIRIKDLFIYRNNFKFFFFIQLNFPFYLKLSEYTNGTLHSKPIQLKMKT